VILPGWVITTTALAILHTAGAPAVTPGWQPGSDTVTVASVQAAATTPARYKAVIADVERWRYTPVWQQRHPAWAIRGICAIAHARGEECIAAPALDLYGGQPARYLASGIVRRAARSADVWEIQAQSLELRPAVYSRFVHAVARQARHAHPGIKVIAGLTTSSRIGHVTGPALWTAYRSVRRAVSGYWANIPQPGPWCPACGPVNPSPMVYVLGKIAEARA
jgi:hypothetical protein